MVLIKIYLAFCSVVIYRIGAFKTNKLLYVVGLVVTLQLASFFIDVAFPARYFL